MSGELLGRIFPGESEMAARLRAFDWATTSLGHPERWPMNLRTAVGLCLASPLPTQLVWGPERTRFYNDAYIPFVAITTQIEPAIERVFAERQAVRSEDVLVSSDPAHSADEVYATFSLSPILGEADAVEGVYCMCEETTEKVSAKVHADALAAARVKNDFLALFGHEMRNPLSTISTTVQSLLLRSHGPEIELIDRAARHLTRLVDDLLDMSRLSRGQVSLRRARVELASIVDDALQRVASQLEERNTRTSTEVRRVGLVVDCDPARISQVLANVIRNASQFSKPGTRVQIEADRVDDRLQIRIRDQGVGIEPSKLPHVFETVHDRADAGGLGLGLSIARKLIDLHGGTLALHSEGEGKGVECVIELPVFAGPSAAATESSPRASRVLLVEDNHDTAVALQAALRELGYEVAVAHDAPVALTVAQSFKPDVALIDINLPVIDGWELSRRLRALRVPSRELHFVAVTARDQESDKQRSAEAGFAEHLVKPIDLKRLEQVVENLRATAG